MKSKILLALRIIIALILIQTLRFKFTAHPDSVYIFKQAGMEPIGRIGIGVLELIASILLLTPETVWAGAALAMGVLAGAVFMHLSTLGISVNGDGGILFTTALITFILSSITLYFYRKDIPFLNLK